MQTKLINGKTLIFVEVPEGVRDPHLLPVMQKEEKSGLFFGNDKNNLIDFIDLPPGSYSIIGLASELTEEQWIGIVEYAHTFGYRKYDAPGGAYQWCARAVYSGLSLLSSLNLNPKTTLIIQKQ